MNEPLVGNGLAMLEAEMARQHADARASLDAARPVVERIVNSVAETGRLILTGMGASHYGNRVAETALRRAGIDATAIPASELLGAPATPSRHTLLLVSQSGESGEIAAWLDRASGTDHEFGLTLAPTSRLGRARLCLIGAGGPERAFAATRSLFLQLALLAQMARALGADVGGIEAVLAEAPSPSVDEAVERLAGAGSYVLSGRGISQGLAESGALTLMELARVPAFSLEGGQFRHGPLEILGPRTGVILLRPAGVEGERTASLAETVVATGAPVVMLDASGDRPVEGAVTLPCPRGADFAAAIGMLPTLQRLLIDLSGRFVEEPGVPLRSTKITREL